MLGGYWFKRSEHRAMDVIGLNRSYSVYRVMLCRLLLKSRVNYRWPLDVLVVRKLGVPGEEELAMGAIASGGTVINQMVVHELGISLETIKEVAQQERMEIERRERAYRDGRAVTSRAAGSLCDSVTFS